MQAILPNEVLFLLNHWDAPRCPKCGNSLHSVYETFGKFIECDDPDCFFVGRAD